MVATATASTIETARNKATVLAEKIVVPNVRYRRDIGSDLVAQDSAFIERLKLLEPINFADIWLPFESRGLYAYLRAPDFRAFCERMRLRKRNSGKSRSTAPYGNYKLSRAGFLYQSSDSTTIAARDTEFRNVRRNLWRLRAQ